MHDKKFWDEVYRKGFLPWIDKGKDSFFASKIIKDTQMCQSAKVLDYGCGVGKIGEYFLSHGIDVDFAEISSLQVDYLKNKFGDKSKIYEVSEPKDIDEKYDIIICSTVLHRIEPEKWPDFLNQFSDLLNVGGKLWLSGFDRNDEILKQENGSFRATSGKCWFISDMVEMAKSLGFEVLENDYDEVLHHNFDKPRTYRFICLRPKKENLQEDENSPKLKFNKSADRVEYAAQKLQNLRDSRSDDRQKNEDMLMNKNEKMKKALIKEGYSPQDMGKTGDEKTQQVLEKQKNIAHVQTAIYKEILGRGKENK